jgi:ABC-type antimicrobial peptide transport system permease subunit
MALAGCIIGLVAGLIVGRVAETLLFGVAGTDPWVLTAAALVVLATVFSAGAIPAFRASRVAPMEALRYE